MTTGEAGVGLGNVAGGRGACVVIGARFGTAEDGPAAEVEEDAAGARLTVLDGRGRDDIAGVVVDGFGDVTNLEVEGSFFAVVDVDVDGASDRRLEAPEVAVFAAVVVAARVGTDEDGTNDARKPVLVVVADFFTAGWVVPLLRVVLDAPGLA